MKRTKDFNTNKGITLIALVITIIVMLILVAVIISMSVNGGLFDYAGKAVGETKNALDAEREMANGGIEVDGVLYSSIDEYLSGHSGTYGSTEKDEDGMLTANATYTQGGYTATIPKGFKVSDVAGEKTIKNGLVIEDAEGNQFVWIPVEEGTFETTEWGNDNMTGEEYIEQMNLDSMTEDELITKLATISATDYRYEGYSSLEEVLWLYGIIENQTDTYTIENLKTYINEVGTQYIHGLNEVETAQDAKEGIIKCYTLSEEYSETAENDPTGLYTSMMGSVQKYGGFYIGRYEAGSTTPRDYDTLNGTTEMVVKKGAYPYNSVVWGTSMTNYEDEYVATYNSKNYGHGAVYLSKNMYTGDEYGVQSTLCYGVQWDATLRFIRDKVNVTTDSSSWGNQRGHEFTFTGKYITESGKTWLDATNETKPGYESWLLTTGASEVNKSKNIYDLLGNLIEWTMETYHSNWNERRFCSRCVFFDRVPAGVFPLP